MSNDPFFAINTLEQPWEERFNEKLGRALYRKNLHTDAATGAEIRLVRYPAGVINPLHSHPCGHGMYVLEGCLVTHKGTFGHAFEALAGYGALLHGEAVSIGMICASRLAESLGRIQSSDTRRQIDLLSALHLPVTVPAEMQQRHDDIVGCMMLDKKTEGRELRFVLPSRIGHVETVRGISPDIALRCL